MLKGLLLFIVTCHAASYHSPRIYPWLVVQTPTQNFLAHSILSSYEVLKQEWDIFKETHNKKYGSLEEDLKRMEIFAQNKLFIARHNDLYEKGVVTFSVKMNEFGDMTGDEFNNIYGMNNENFDDDNIDDGGSVFKPPRGYVIPKEKDWREEGAVTEVRNQSVCGSCWAFSAVGALEGHYFVNSHHLVQMSEQNLVDCSTKFGNSGCNGGWPYKAFKYTVENGIDTEMSYHYEAKQGTCRYNPKYVVTKPKGFHRLRRIENHLRIAVGAKGPVSVIVDSHGDAFRFYDNGVHYNATCSSKRKDLNHAVLVVGYGATDSGLEYWLVKNSWGKAWGDQGYIKMARNRENNCGIVTDASLPLF